MSRLTLRAPSAGKNRYCMKSQDSGPWHLGHSLQGVGEERRAVRLNFYM